MSSSMGKTAGYVGKTDLFKVDPREIIVKPGFNPRSSFDIEDLKESIRDNGFYLDKPLLLNRRDTKLILIDGERRLRAVLSLIEEGVPIVSVPAVLDVSQNDGDLLARALSANANGIALEPFDEASAFGRLVGYGWEPKKIAQKTGRSLSHVYGRLKLLGASDEVKNAVHTGEITVTEAVRVVEKSSKDDLTQQDALVEAVKVRKEKKENHKIAKVRIGYMGVADVALREILATQGVAWVVGQLLIYADKEEVLDAIHDAVDKEVM